MTPGTRVVVICTGTYEGRRGEVRSSDGLGREGRVRVRLDGDWTNLWFDRDELDELREDVQP